MAPNKTFVYNKIPTGMPVVGEHLAVEDRPIDIETAPKGGLVLEIQYASLDPYMRGRMRDPSVSSYFPALQVGGPATNTVAATVLKSDVSDFPEGETVLAFAPIAQYARIDNPAASSVRKINNPHNLDLSLFLGPLGMPGLTAYSALHKIGKPQKGETILVSSAAGAVGQLVGQIAKQKGLRVLGSVGSDEKLEFIRSLGYDDGFNYKKETPADALKRLAPDGLDIYFENVGGAHLEAALEKMKQGGRIPVCGMIDSYNTPREEQKGIRGLMNLISSGITMEGFLVSHPGFGPAYAKEHQENMGKWLAEGSVQAKLHVTPSIDEAPEGFVGMLEGKNIGKALIKIR